jgi:branched-chain amino acid transport system substrate-binding protein
MMATWVTHPNLTGIGQYIFRNSYSDEDTGRMMAETINRQYQKIVVISESSDYPIGLLSAFKKYFQGEIIEENYPPETKDFRSYALSIISKKPEAVLVNPASPLGGLAALKQLRQLGYKGPLYGNYFGEVGDVLNSPEAQGMVFFTDPDVGNNALKDQLFSKLESLSGHQPNFKFADAVTYDSIYILKQAIENVGSDPDDLKDYLHNLKNFQGVMGTYGFNDQGDAVGYFPAIKEIKNGQVVEYKP